MRIRFWFVLGLCVSGISWLYVHRILEPWTNHVHASERTTQMGDLYSPWVGTRELLLHRRNPYGRDVSREIQMVFYGHAINQTYGTPGVALVNEQRFAYPIYVVFLMGPTIFFDFSEVQRWAPLVLGSLTAISVVLYLQVLGWRLPWQAVTTLVLFTLSSPQIVQGLRLEQLAVVVGFLLSTGAWCVNRNRLATGGMLLAFSTIKPQMAIIPLCWFAIWALGDWRQRRRLVASFIATLAVVIVAGELLCRGWPGYFLAGLAAYRKYFPTTSLLRVALGDTLGGVMGGLIAVALLAFAWRNRKVAGDSPQFVSLLSLFFAGAILAFPLLTPFNQVMLILPAMLILHDWKALPRPSRVIFAVIISWPWFFSLVLLLFPPRLDSPSQIPLLPSLLVLFAPLILPLLLMTRPSEASESQPSAAASPLSGR